MKKRSKSIAIAGVIMLIYSLWILGSILLRSLPIRVPPYKMFHLLFVNTFSIFIYRFWYVTLFFGLVYLISSINILRLKNWARLLAVYLSGLIVGFVVVIALNLFILAFKSGFLILGDSPLAWGLYGAWVAIIPCLPSLLFLYFFTRPKIKEQLRKVRK